jgi:hypothetical protein
MDGFTPTEPPAEPYAPDGAQDDHDDAGADDADP